MPIKDIAEKYNTVPASISYINSGQTWVRSELSYPIFNYRPNRDITKKPHYCDDCGVKVYKYSKRCRKCSCKAKMKIDNFDIDQIKQDLEDHNYNKTRVASIYGVTDNTIKK